MRVRLLAIVLLTLGAPPVAAQQSQVGQAGGKPVQPPKPDQTAGEVAEDFCRDRHTPKCEKNVLSDCHTFMAKTRECVTICRPKGTC